MDTKMKTYQKHSSTIGNLNGNIIAMFCYLGVYALGWLGFVAAIIFFFIEKKSGLVKFHAAQSILLSIFSSIVTSFFSIILNFFLWNDVRHYYYYSANLFSLFQIAGGGLIGLLTAGLSLLVLVLTIWCAVKAYLWQDWQIPLIGQIAMSISHSWSPAQYYGDGPVPPECEPGPRPAGFGDTPYQQGGQPPYGQPLHPQAGQPQQPQGGQPPMQQPPAAPQQPYTPQQPPQAAVAPEQPVQPAAQPAPAPQPPVQAVPGAPAEAETGEQPADDMQKPPEA